MRPMILAAVLSLFTTGTAWGEPSKDAEKAWTFELQFASYRPRIDSQFESQSNSLSAPYETAFGTGGDLMFTFAFERHILMPFGSLSAGFSLGYWNVEGESVAASSASSSDAADTTEMSIFPLFMQATYRLDEWVDIVPIAPVVRIGLDYYMWRVYDGGGDVAQFGPGQDAEGGTWGWHSVVGLHILLDYLAQDMAADFKQNAGVHNTYLTIEYRRSQVDDFGSATSFRLGDDTFFIGLALEL
ncbi:MAG: MXAN_2562 family outer membrane beta-barrel protein [Myxococcota bacterium]|nr:MXAN_2562 family outer membrane beta-barrel protein [Myxococcota bacterium]